MASVDPGLLLGQLREEQAELRRRRPVVVPDFFGWFFGGEACGTQPKKGKGGAAWPFVTVPTKT